MPPRQLLKPRYWPTWIGLGLLYLVTRLPLSWQMKVGKWIGLAFHAGGRSRRHIADTNIRLCFPEKSEAERKALVRDIFISTGIGMIETLISWFHPPEYLLSRTTFHGFDKLQKAKDEGRGVLVLGAHYSMLDLAGSLFVTQADINVSYRPQDNEVMNYVMETRRDRLYKSCFTRKDIRAFIRTLKAGEILWYAQDQDFGRTNSVFVDFFGVPAATITATSRIAKAGNALVMPLTYFRRDDLSGYDLTLFDPLNIPSGDDVADAREANAFLEQQLRQHPEQYLWMHKRFKTPVNPEEKKGLLYRR